MSDVEQDQQEQEQQAYANLEFWIDIPGYESLYAVSNLGRVMSLRKGVIMKYCIVHGGYRRIDLYKNKERKSCKIHRLVAQGFLDDWDESLTVDHINHITTDNRDTNLRMMTASKNSSNQNKDGKTSKYIGVHWNKTIKKWLSKINYNKKNKHLGVYTNEIDAAQARDKFILDNDLQDDYQLTILSSQK